MTSLFKPKDKCPLNPDTKQRIGASTISTVFLVLFGLGTVSVTLYTIKLALSRAEKKPSETVVLGIGLAVYWVGFYLYFAHWKQCAPWSGYGLFLLGSVISAMITHQLIRDGTDDAHKPAGDNASSPTSADDGPSRYRALVAGARSLQQRKTAAGGGGLVTVVSSQWLGVSPELVATPHRLPIWRLLNVTDGTVNVTSPTSIQLNMDDPSTRRDNPPADDPQLIPSVRFEFVARPGAPDTDPLVVRLWVQCPAVRGETVLAVLAGTGDDARVGLVLPPPPAATTDNSLWFLGCDERSTHALPSGRATVPIVLWPFVGARDPKTGGPTQQLATKTADDDWLHPATAQPLTLRPVQPTGENTSFWHILV